jgi:hypothetical protein
VLSLNPRLRAGAEELLQALVREALYHSMSVSLDDTDVNGECSAGDRSPGLKCETLGRLGTGRATTSGPARGIGTLRVYDSRK